MRFAVVADTHVRPEDLDPGDFEANAHLAARNRHVVEMLNRLGPAFVIHLGDVVHPVPGDPHHAAANALAAAAYDVLTMPLHVVPGNHDVGDKPFPWVDAPKAAEEHYGAFEARWGPRWRSFSRGGCRFVLIDTPVLGTGTEAERAHWRWFEQTLADAEVNGERTFVFGHYPPYLWDPDEEEHYDNLGLGARRRLLALIERYRVEAVFSGHVHRFFHRRHLGTDLYVVPAVGFVRPGYAEFDAVAPAAQFGRDDRAKLGLFIVEVTSDGHVVRPVRTWGDTSGGTEAAEMVAAPGWETHLGVTFRHGWAAPRELAMGGLDEFTRTLARDDAPTLALWEARIRRVRIPLGDLARPETRERVLELAARGVEFTVLVAGVGRLEDVPPVAAVTRWEVVLAPGEVWDARMPRPPSGVVAVGPLTPWEGSGWSHGHFVAHGFRPDIDPEALQATVGPADEAVFRIGPDAPVWETAEAVTGIVSASGMGAVVVAQLPRRSEGSMFDDDTLVANRVVEAEIVARSGVEVFLDGFGDHDRGYFPRVGLLDRRADPRPSLGALVALGHAADGPGRLVENAGSVRLFEGDGWRLALVSDPVEVGGRWRSLLDGRHREGRLDRGPWLAVGRS